MGTGAGRRVERRPWPPGPWRVLGRLALLATTLSLGLALAGPAAAAVPPPAGPIGARWTELGGATGVLGPPLTAEYAVPGGRAQDFRSGTIVSTGAGTWEVQAAILLRYRALGGPGGALGAPTTGTQRRGPGGRFGDFTGGSIFWSPTAGAHELTGDLLTAYRAAGGPGGALGWPLSSVRPVGDGRMALFQGGVLTWRPGPEGVHSVSGAVGVRYAQLGGAAGVLGFPAAGEAAAGVAGAQVAVFDAGRIYWSAATGAVEVRGSILARYLQDGGPAAYGLPLTGEVPVGDGRVSVFQRARIYWSTRTGAWPVQGGILDRYLSLGGPAALGFPRGTEVEAGVPGGRMSDFEAGRIYWSAPTGANEVRGSILEHYLWLGGPGAFGLPLTGETDVPGGRQSVFQLGRIYWGMATGAHVVYGGILARYLAEGGPGSFLGLPRTDEYAVPGGRRSDFVGGSLVYDAATGAVRVETPWAPVVSGVSLADVPYSFRGGCPLGPAGLRRLDLPYWDFAGRMQRGTLVVAASVVPSVLRIFERAFRAQFPIRQMLPVDVFGGDDPTSMAADNTSGFNCRKVVGNPYRVSQHSYGNAVDVNPAENPYVTRSTVYPPGSQAFLDRGNVRTGMLVPGGPVPSAMAAEGWLWGARWALPDYQHFSANGG